jgi:hypothetical protein
MSVPLFTRTSLAYLLLVILPVVAIIGILITGGDPTPPMGTPDAIKPVSADQAFSCCSRSWF